MIPYAKCMPAYPSPAPVSPQVGGNTERADTINKLPNLASATFLLCFYFLPFIFCRALLSYIL